MHRVTPGQLPTVWPKIRDYLIAAIRKSDEGERCQLDLLMADIISGRSQLWVAVKEGEITCATVTLLCEQYGGWSVCIYLMGGRGMSEWIEQVHEEIVRFAKENDAKWIDACTRPGIGKLLTRNFGYNMKNVFYTREV